MCFILFKIDKMNRKFTYVKKLVAVKFRTINSKYTKNYDVLFNCFIVLIKLIFTKRVNEYVDSFTLLKCCKRTQKIKKVSKKATRGS